MAIADVVTDIEFVLATENVDSPIFMLVPKLRAWRDALEGVETTSLNKYEAGLTIGAVPYREQGSFAATEAQADGEGFALVLTSLPVVIGATSEVLNLSSLIFNTYDLIAGVENAFDLGATLYVSNTIDTNVAKAIISAQYASGVGGDKSINWTTTATKTIPKGADLAWTAGSLGSTAGGIFVATLIVTGGWD